MAQPLANVDPAVPTPGNTPQKIVAIIGVAVVVAAIVGYFLWFGGTPDKGLLVERCALADTIVFSAKDGEQTVNDIFVACVENDMIAKITDSTADSGGPSLSPDGKTVIFYNERDGTWEIFSFNRDTSVLVQLTETSFDSTYPSFSPSGSEIVFSSNRSGVWGIYSMNADGTQVRNLSDRGDSHPRYSPDGSRIVYSSTENKGTIYQIWIMDSDGNGKRRITTKGANSFPSYSPDGTQVVFESRRQSGVYDIYVMNANGDSEQQVVFSSANDGMPIFSPDGVTIYFVSDRGSRLTTLPYRTKATGGVGKPFLDTNSLSNVKRISFPMFAALLQQP